MDIDKKNVSNSHEIEKLKSQIASLKKNKLFGLVWEEKEEDVVSFSKENIPILRDNLKNEIYKDPLNICSQLIVGDNYLTLINLNFIYKNEVDVIYIDPPYNTGEKDWKFNDNFVDKDDSFRHSKWLSMMNVRLNLAKSLLKNDGLLLVSIGDDEFANLKLLLDQIFGESAFICDIPWQKRTSKSDVPYGISQNYEHILVYGKQNFESGKPIIRDYYTSDDFKDDPWRLGPMTTQRTKEERPNSYFTMVNPKNGDKFEANPNRTWACTKDTFKKYYEENKIVFPGDYDFLNIGTPYFRYFKSEDDAKNNGETPLTATSNVLDKSIVGMTSDGTKELTNILGSKKFNFPKPSSLIKYLINFHLNKNAVVLDFFAGSGTTGHAVLELNKEDGGNRQFILVTNNENNIAEEVTYPRLKNVINGYKNLKNEKVEGLGGNLKYYEIDFVPADNSDPSMYELAINLVDTLCLKENTFTEHHTSKDIKIFKNQEDHYCCIVFDEDKIDQALQKLNNTDGSYSFYIYSLGGETFDEELEDFISEHPNTISTPFPLTMKNIYKSLK